MNIKHLLHNCGYGTKVDKLGRLHGGGRQPSLILAATRHREFMEALRLEREAKAKALLAQAEVRSPSPAPSAPSAPPSPAPEQAHGPSHVRWNEIAPAAPSQTIAPAESGVVQQAQTPEDRARELEAQLERGRRHMEAEHAKLMNYLYGRFPRTEPERRPRGPLDEWLAAAYDSDWTSKFKI